MAAEGKYAPRLILIAEDWLHTVVKQAGYPFVAQSTDLTHCEGKLKALGMSSQLVTQPKWQEEGDAIQTLLCASADQVHELIGRGHPRIDSGPHSVVMAISFGVIDQGGCLVNDMDLVTHNDMCRFLIVVYSFQPDSGAEAMNEAKVAIASSDLEDIVALTGSAEKQDKVLSIFMDDATNQTGLLDLFAEHLSRWSISSMS